MSTDSSRRIQVPDELKEVLLQFSISYLVEQPPDLIDFAADYFNKLQANRPVSGSTENTGDDNQSVNSQEGDGKSGTDNQSTKFMILLKCSWSMLLSIAASNQVYGCQVSSSRSLSIVNLRYIPLV